MPGNWIKLNNNFGMAIKNLDIICFSHLRWNLVYQRPQHLLARFSRLTRIFYIEEPVFDERSDFYHVAQPEDNVWVVTPHIQRNHSEKEKISRQIKLLSGLFTKRMIKK